jgi:hypothetical protein
MLRTIFIHSHDVVEVSPLPPGMVDISHRGRGFRPNIWLHWLDGEEEHRAWGEVTQGDYEELSNPDSSWYYPRARHLGQSFRFVYYDEDAMDSQVEADPNDPLHIPW